ncbi:MAG: DUF6266 family protein [Bacteroidota bacterium]
MAKLPSGIFGPISGKLGNLIGGIWKGIPYLKENKPRKLKLDRTPAQLANEEKFRFANNWLIPFHPFIGVGFLTQASQRTTISAALSQVYNTVFTGTYPDLEIHADQMVISVGKLTPVLNTQIVMTAPDTISVTWEKNTQRGTKYNDQIMVVLYDSDQHIADGFVGGVNRATEQYTFKFNDYLIGKTLHAYISVTSINRTNISNSQYLGTINPFQL